MEIRWARAALPLVATTAALLSACGGTSNATTSSGAGGPATSSGSSTGPATTAIAPCLDDLSVVGSTASDGPLAPGSFLADEGPHPANTVDSDRTLELGLASYVLEPDPQFGVSIPIGVPRPPDGGTILLASLSKDSTQPPIAVGDRFTSERDPSRAPEDGTINNIGLFSAAEGRINPLGAVTLTVTSLDDTRVCGTISTATSTGAQALPGVEGSFAADRIQALEGH